MFRNIYLELGMEAYIWRKLIFFSKYSLIVYSSFSREVSLENFSIYIDTQTSIIITLVWFRQSCWDWCSYPVMVRRHHWVKVSWSSRSYMFFCCLSQFSVYLKYRSSVNVAIWEGHPIVSFSLFFDNEDLCNS